MPGKITTGRIETFECDCCSETYTKTTLGARKRERESVTRPSLRLEHPIRQVMSVDVYDQPRWSIICNVCYDDRQQKFFHL